MNSRPVCPAPRQRLARLLRRSLAAGLLATLSSLPALAQAPAPAASPEARRQVLFAQLERNPADLEANFEYAKLSSDAGDLEAAIGALERMLFFNPALRRVKLELGLLYFRLGSYEMARSYFDAALEGPDTPPEVRARVAGFLTEIDRRLQTSQTSFYAQTGLRYQTNANAGPNGRLVRALGFDAVLDQAFARKGDWNWFALLSGTYVYDFGNQRGDTFEASVSAYYSKQFRIGRLDLGLVEVQLGPRLALAPGDYPGASIKPYVVANVAALGEAYYLGTLGAGVTTRLPVGLATVEPFVEYRRRDYDNTGFYPLASQQTGNLLATGAQLNWSFGYGLTLQGRGVYERNSADFSFHSYHRYAVDVAVAYEFEPLLGAGSRRWALQPYAGFGWSDYDSANPLIDPVRRRRDRDWRVGVALDAPIYKDIGFAVNLQRAVTNSNLPNFETRNWSITVGPTVRF